MICQVPPETGRTVVPEAAPQAQAATARVVIAGGGTGGHAIPALCVAHSLARRGVEVEFFGAHSGIESRLVPEAGYRLHTLPLEGFSGGPARRVRAVWLFAKATGAYRRLLSRLRPGAMLGVGGYASASAVLAARSLSIPIFLLEGNAVSGRANRLAGRFARGVFAAFPEAGRRLPRAEHTGLPVREEFFQAAEAGERERALGRLGLDPPVVLVFGGSGGALKLNTACVEAFGQGETPYTVVQVAGRRDYDALSTRNPRHRILEYEGRMWDLFAAAEVAVIRAGMSSVFETAAAGRPAILVPYPHATDDHQLRNARRFTERGAAEILPDAGLDGETLRLRVEALLADENRRLKMSRRLRELSVPQASEKISERLLRASGTVEDHRDSDASRK